MTSLTYWLFKKEKKKLEHITFYFMFQLKMSTLEQAHQVILWGLYISETQLSSITLRAG